MDSMALSDTAATEVADGVYCTPLAAGKEATTQHFHVEPGAELPAHGRDQELWGFVYRGALTFLADDEVVIASSESYLLESGEAHPAVNNGSDPVLGVEVFVPPRADPTEPD